MQASCAPRVCACTCACHSACSHWPCACRMASHGGRGGSAVSLRASRQCRCDRGGAHTARCSGRCNHCGARTAHAVRCCAPCALARCWCEGCRARGAVQLSLSLSHTHTHHCAAHLRHTLAVRCPVWHSCVRVLWWRCSPGQNRNRAGYDKGGCRLCWPCARAATMQPPGACVGFCALVDGRGRDSCMLEARVVWCPSAPEGSPPCVCGLGLHTTTVPLRRGHTPLSWRGTWCEWAMPWAAPQGLSGELCRWVSERGGCAISLLRAATHEQRQGRRGARSETGMYGVCITQVQACV